MSREQKQINRDKHIKLMGVYKWQLLGKAYPLDGTRTPTERELERARRILNGGRFSDKMQQPMDRHRVVK